MNGDERFQVTTRFAPSPSGSLHVGHLLAAREARRLADEHGGRCLLRVEDIDLARCRREYVAPMLEELAWLGFRFDGPVVFQSDRFPLYARACERLRALGTLYPCFCTRKEIRAQLAEADRAPHGPLGSVYPGTCRSMSEDERQERIARGEPHCWRLDCRRAQELVGCLFWVDLMRGEQRCEPSKVGDVALARKDFPASYHLAVVIDDAEQGVTHVTRGEDLFEATHVHRTLQALLELPVPVWKHHGLLRDASGKRLAKRDDARSIAAMRAAGASPASLLASLDFATERGGIWQAPC